MAAARAWPIILVLSKKDLIFPNPPSEKWDWSSHRFPPFGVHRLQTSGYSFLGSILYKHPTERRNVLGQPAANGGPGNWQTTKESISSARVSCGFVPVSYHWRTPLGWVTQKATTFCLGSNETIPTLVLSVLLADAHLQTRNHTNGCFSRDQDDLVNRCNTDWVQKLGESALFDQVN